MKYFKKYNSYSQDIILENINLSNIFIRPVSNIPDLNIFYNYVNENNFGIDEAIDSLPTISIDIDTLTPTKNFLDEDNIKNKINSKPKDENDLPFIFKIDGDYYIIDGHHRLTLFKYLKKKFVNVKFFDADKIKEEQL